MSQDTPPKRLERPPHSRILTIGLLVVVLAFVTWDLWDRAQQQEKVEVSQSNAAEIARQVTEACDRNGPTARELGDTCRQAKEVEEEPSEPQPRPPSDEQVARAVASYCSGGACRGQDGTDGESVTASQVAAAVSRYCNTRGECQGPSGADGEDGEDSQVPGPQGEPGEDGETIVGPTGPGPTSEQIAAAVASFCANDACKGAKGDPGSPGVDGQDGADGQPPVSWTYTDALGREHTCTRTEPFDPDAPTYTCN